MNDRKPRTAHFGPTWPEVNGGPRELSREERAAIKKLVVSLCANYSRDYGCLPLDYGGCYMLDKWWTGCYCKYFQQAVLPDDPVLEAALTGGAVETRPCALCGAVFPVDGKRAYCSDACANNALRRQKREYIRKKRSRV